MHIRSSGLATTAATAVLALVTGTVLALPAHGAPGTAAPSARQGPQEGPQQKPKQGSAPGPVAHTLTLITGDEVSVDARGAVVRVALAKGREHIPVRTERVHGSTRVLPSDAGKLVSAGRLDPRLFDTVELLRARQHAKGAKAAKSAKGAKAAGGSGTGGGLPLIIGYEGAKAAKAAAPAPTASAEALKGELREDGGVRVRRALPRLNAEAVTVSDAAVRTVWDTLTAAPAAGRSGVTAAPGLARVWLDGVRTASLDTSTTQIGAPAAWSKGLDGKGVRIAVLDSGVDETHPELKGRQAAERNFSDSPDAKDRHGHGTHVASIAAGTGQGSAGKYRGVASGAEILDGKVLNDEGAGSDSEVVAGMEWAAEQNADVVNLSLGARNGPWTDPLEETVNRLSAERGILFVVAAGNSGPGAGTVESPGSAEKALTVGGVDKKDAMYARSSWGPSADKGGLKPDVTAPGVAVTAASAPGSTIAQKVGENPAGYVTISGTSMATPHVAGAAALLKQRHPTWTGEQLKAVLMGSAKSGGHDLFAEGSGRVDVSAALENGVVSEPASLSFDKQSFPHEDDEPTTKKISYRNLGDAPVTLDLKASGRGPGGKPAPEGMFTLSEQRVTVPAGDTAVVRLTADTRLGGTLNGVYAGTVTATGGGQTLRTNAAVDREGEHYSLTVRHVGLEGQAEPDHDTYLNPLAGEWAGTGGSPMDGGADVTLRVPKGVYFLTAFLGLSTGKYSQIAAPHLEVNGDTEVTLDARTARPVSIKGPDPAAKSRFASTSIELSHPVESIGFTVGANSPGFDGVRFAQYGPDYSSGGTLTQLFHSVAENGDREYQYLYGGAVTKLATGLERRAKAGDFAALDLRLGAQRPGKQGTFGIEPILGGRWVSIFPHFGPPRPLPRNLRLFLASDSPDAQWSPRLLQLGETEESVELRHGRSYESYEAGKTYRRDMGVGVYGANVGGGQGITREGDLLKVCADVMRDAGGHWSAPGLEEDPGSTTLTRDGVAVPAPLYNDFCYTGYKVPAAEGRYELAVTADRTTPATRPTKVSANWTFTSGRTDSAAMVPFSVVRFAPKLASDTTARAGVPARVPVIVQGAAATAGVKSLKVEFSLDGRTWLPTPVVKGSVTVLNPKAGKAISLRAKLVDKQGNTFSQTIENAYWGK
ncbi:S8 family peptidase [Streptomyces sp. NPDC050504]|uniref:S8 family peptidase n=1 Tax=Streptomyces sp. NPDC050504 TaxID=3365618 RepID=UPI00379EF643